MLTEGGHKGGAQSTLDQESRGVWLERIMGLQRQIEMLNEREVERARESTAQPRQVATAVMTRGAVVAVDTDGGGSVGMVGSDAMAESDGKQGLELGNENDNDARTHGHAALVGLCVEGSSGAKPVDVPTWAMMAKDWKTARHNRAIAAVKFSGCVPHLSGAHVMDALEAAAEGREEFVCYAVCDGVWRFDYKQPRASLFEARRDTTKERHKAMLRREMRGLMVRSTGEVVLRGFHKFFNYGEVEDTKLRTLKGQRIREVTMKLDGQMIVGVVLGGEAQFWSKKGITETGLTDVGRSAGRVAEQAGAGCAALVQHVHRATATACFEFMGYQSEVKTPSKQRWPRLVLTAVRDNCSGEYWGHDVLVQLGARFRVEVVERIVHLEMMTVQQVVHEVHSWKGLEGVIVTLQSGQMLKVKSDWWFRAGYCSKFRQEAKSWRQEESKRRLSRLDRLRVRTQRLAVLQCKVMKATDVFHLLPNVMKLEVASNKAGKITAMIASFVSTDDLRSARSKATELGWRSQMAYSCRTNTRKVGRRFDIYNREEDMVLPCITIG